MTEDRTQRARAIRRRIDLALAPVKARMISMVSWTKISGASAGAGKVPQATLADGDDVQVLEPYGFAGSPAGASTAIVVAPGGETSDRVAIGLSSQAGRPQTDAGDVAMYSSAGHSVVMDDDGAMTMTGKDGQQLVMAADGSCSISLDENRTLTFDVSGTGEIRLGGAAAVQLLKAQATQTHLAAAGAFAILPGNFLPNDGGVKLMQSFVAFLTGTLPAPPSDLVAQAGTTKAKGE